MTGVAKIATGQKLEKAKISKSMRDSTENSGKVFANKNSKNMTVHKKRKLGVGQMQHPRLTMSPLQPSRKRNKYMCP